MDNKKFFLITLVILLFIFATSKGGKSGPQFANNRVRCPPPNIYGTLFAGGGNN